jgi:glycosyltransferase involved in cell wall biosynthesis
MRATIQPRMLIVTTIPATFGFLAPYARHLRRQGWWVDLASGTGELPAAWQDGIDGRIEIPWSRRLGGRTTLASIRAARRVLATGNYAIVHTHTPIASFAVRLAAATIPRSRRPAIVYTAHGFHFAPGQNPLVNAAFIAAEWIAGRWTDRLVVINDHDVHAARRFHLVRGDRLVYMPGIGLDLDWYRASDDLAAAGFRLREELGIPRAAPLLTIIAELSHRKKQDLALRALALLDRRDVHLALAGEGPRSAEYRQLARSLGISDRVHFLGHLGDVRPLIVTSAATLLPSYREGLSRAVLESLAMGVPVVGSDIRGIADVVEPDGGLLVPPGDVAALAQAITEVLETPRPADMADRVRQRLAPFSLDDLIAAHEQLYGSLLGRTNGKHAVLSAVGQEI